MHFVTCIVCCFSFSVLQMWDLRFLWHCVFWVLKWYSPEHFGWVCCLQQVTYIFEYFCLVCVRNEVVERLNAFTQHLFIFLRGWHNNSEYQLVALEDIRGYSGRTLMMTLVFLYSVLLFWLICRSCFLKTLNCVLCDCCSSVFKKKYSADLHVCIVYLYIFERSVVIMYVQGDWYHVLTITMERPWEHFKSEQGTWCNTLPFRSNVCYSYFISLFREFAFVPVVYTASELGFDRQQNMTEQS